MDLAIESGSDSDVSESWSFADLRPEEAESILKRSVDSGLQSSKEFLLVDSNVDECFELTEMTFSDPLGVVDSSQLPTNAVPTNSSQELDDESDGISVIYDDDTSNLVKDVEELDKSIEESVNNPTELTDQRVNPSEVNGNVILHATNWLRMTPAFFPRSNVGMFTIGILLFVAARQVFIYDDERERERLAVAIENLERLNAANEALQKQIQQSLDAMALNVDAIHRCPQTIPLATDDSTTTEKPIPEQKEVNLKIKEVLPLFKFFLQQHNLTSLLNLTKRLENALEVIGTSSVIGKDIMALDQKLSVVILKLLKNSGGTDTEILVNRLKNLTDRFHRCVKRGKKLAVKDDLHIVQWFASNDDGEDDVIFVKDEELKVGPQPLPRKKFDGCRSSTPQQQQIPVEILVDESPFKTDYSAEEVVGNRRLPRNIDSIEDEKKIVQRSKERKYNPKRRDKTDRFFKNNFKSKHEWQLERGKARESIRRNGGKNRYFRSTGMLVL